MRQILILDTETSGLDCSKDAVSSWASLLRVAENPAEAINRIPAAQLAELDPIHSVDSIARIVGSMAQHADAIVAYNAEFDRGFLQVALGGPVLRDGEPLPWVCANEFITWPRGSSSKALTSIALAHDLGVSHAHRAAVDVDLIARLLTRSRELGSDLEVLLDAALKEALRPRGRVVALVSYAQREGAKSAGFKWDGEKKEWWKHMPLDNLPPFDFPVRLPREDEAGGQ